MDRASSTSVKRMEERISAIGLRFGLSRPVSISLVVLTALSTAVCWLAYAGPYRWLSELLLRVVGADYLGLTVVLTGFGLGLAFFAAAQLARRLGLLQTVVHSSRRARSASARFFSRTRAWLVVVLLGAACLAFGARESRVAHAGERLERVASAALESGARPASSWLQVEGKLFEAARIELEPYSYVPLVSPSWAPGRPVAVVLKMDARETPAPDARVFRGTRDALGLPVLARGSYQDMGFDVRRALVLELGTTPADRSGRAQGLAGVGSALLAFGLLGAALRVWRAHRRHAQTSATARR
jgi:hypothetical protein